MRSRRRHKSTSCAHPVRAVAGDPDPDRWPLSGDQRQKLTDWLGERCRTGRRWRCADAASRSVKPFCDGTCAPIGFTDAKDPNRVADRRDTYVGQQVTVLDNRGICQHSGFCTDRLATVFRLGQEPFVSPSGGRMDEIIRAVRDCPSGALSYAIDGVEARDAGRPRTTSASRRSRSQGRPVPDHRRTIALIDGSGEHVPRNEAPRGSTTRCAAAGTPRTSRSARACTGTSSSTIRCPTRTRTPTMFEWAGGLPALTRMTRLFYEKHVPEDPLLAPLFANMSADHPQRVAKWLGEVFGGPPLLQRGVRRLPADDLPARRQVPDRGKARALGGSCSCRPPRRPGCPTTRSSARRSAPTSSGDRGSPSRTPRPRRQARRSTCRCRTGIGAPPPDRPAAGSQRSQLPRATTSRRSCCPPPTNRSATNSTSSRCSATATASR